MKYNLPQTITNETDLMHYENYLLNDTAVESHCSFTDNLLKNIGKTAKIYLNSLIITGVINEVGKDFLILNRSGTCTIIPFISIKAVTLPQENRMHRRC